MSRDPEYADLLGRTLPPLTYEVEKGQIRFYTRTLGEVDLIHFDEAAAQAAGYRSIVAPPTFAFSALRGSAEQMPIVDALGWGDDQLGRCLHGEQTFRYGAPICAGDVLTITEGLERIYQKRGGALTFFVTRTRMFNQLAEEVVQMSMTLILQARANG